jgi:hypothetical protein
VRVRACLQRAHVVVICRKVRTASLQALSVRRNPPKPAETDLQSAGTPEVVLGFGSRSGS